MEKRFEGRFYWNYFNRPGVADAEFAKDTRTALRKFFYSASGDAPGAHEGRQPLVDPERGWLATMPDPEVLPDWFTENDLDALTESFSKGFTGALNWYRLDRNWTRPLRHGAVVTRPALYISTATATWSRRSPALPTHRAPSRPHAQPLAQAPQAGRLWTLDSAGTPGRGERGAHPTPGPVPEPGLRWLLRSMVLVGSVTANGGATWCSRGASRPPW